MSRLCPVRCPGCHKKLAEAVEGTDVRLRFRCRDCGLGVVVVLTATAAAVVAAA